MTFVKNTLRRGCAVLAFMAVAAGPALPAYAAQKLKCRDIPLQGEASVYGPGLQNRKTASGEALRLHELTAAHRCLPFGTLVRVTDRKTGKSVTVRINDRGPFVKGRIIDLTPAAVKKLGHTKMGLYDVAISVQHYQPR